MGYFNDAAKGVSWVGAFRLSTRIISLGRTIILARLLSPFYFGVYGIATLVLSLLEILTETGINVVLIQKREKIDDFIDSAFVISIARGILIAALIFLLAPLIANFFSSESSIGVLTLISLVPLIRGFINPSTVKFQKDLKFGKEFWFRFTIFLIDAATALIATLILKNAYGLVIGLIVGAFVEVILSFIYAEPIPKFRIEFQKVKIILQNGKWITGAGIFQFLFRQGDDAVVGRMLGAAPLGIYQVAYKIGTLPISEVTDVFNKVVFPVYVKISGDTRRLKIAFYKTTAVVTLLAIGSGIAIFIVAPFVPLVLGNQWTEIVPILKVLAIFGVFQAVTNSGYSLLLALGKNKAVITLTFIAILGLAITIIPLVNSFGVIGAGFAALVGASISLPFMAYTIKKYV